ncbi:hypothetical protein Tsubulata_033234, partial [Turnera subulata]
MQFQASKAYFHQVCFDAGGLHHLAAAPATATEAIALASVYSAYKSTSSRTQQLTASIEMNNRTPTDRKQCHCKQSRCLKLR